jgi:superfamily II DNA helicase RecQ
VPVIGLTATAPKVQEDILKNLEMSDATTFHHSTDLIFIMRYGQNKKM